LKSTFIKAFASYPKSYHSEPSGEASDKKSIKLLAMFGMTRRFWDFAKVVLV
jgi:hypothetical protein